jgi:hypothetical protein
VALGLIGLITSLLNMMNDAYGREQLPLSKERPSAALLNTGPYMATQSGNGAFGARPYGKKAKWNGSGRD